MCPTLLVPSSSALEVDKALYDNIVTSSTTVEIPITETETEDKEQTSMRPFIVGVDPENLWLTLPAAPSLGSGSLFPTFDSDLDLDLAFNEGKQKSALDEEDYSPSTSPTSPTSVAAGTLKLPSLIRPATRSYSSSHLDRLGFAPLSPVPEASDSEDGDGFDPSLPSSCDGEEDEDEEGVARFDWLEDEEMASSLAYGGIGAGNAATVNDMDVPFGIGGSPTGPANQQLYPAAAGYADPPFDLLQWLINNDDVHSPLGAVAGPSSASAGGAMVPPLLGAQYQTAPSPLQSRFTPDRQRPYRPPQAPSGLPGVGPPTQPAPAQSSSPMVDLLREQVAGGGRSTSLPPPSQPKPLRRRTQDSADIPSIASSYYSTLFPQPPKGDGMATLAPTPPASGTVEAQSPKLKQRAAGTVEGAQGAATATKKEGKPALYRLGNLGLEGLNGQKRPALPSMYSSYAPLPTPSSGSSSGSGTPSPLPTPYPSNPNNADNFQQAVSGPTTDHPLSEAETRDIWERLKRDFAGVDPANLRGPFRQLALQSLKENGIVPQVIGGAANPANMTKRPLPPATVAQPHTPRQAPSGAAANLSAGEKAARLTVSPKEAFLDYDDVSHRLSDPARGRSSPRPLSTALFGAALMERNPSSPITFTGSPQSGGKGRLAAPAMDRRTSMPEVWAKNGTLHHHFNAHGGGPPTPGGGGAGQHVLERRSSPSSGLRLPPHQLPKNAMRISEGAHHDGLHAQASSSAEQATLPLEMVDDYSPSSEEDPSPPVPEALGAPLFGPISDVKSQLTPGGHVVVRSSGDSYFPQGITGGDGAEGEGLRYLAAPSGNEAKGAKGGKTLPSKGRSQSHPPEAGTRTSGRARMIRRRSSTSSPEGSDDDEDEDVPMIPATSRASGRHSDGGAQWSTGKRRAPVQPETPDDDEEEDEEMEEDDEEKEEDEDELEDDDDDDYAEAGGASHKPATSARRKAATTSSGRKRKSAASVAADSLSDGSSAAAGGPSKKRQRHDTSSPRGWGTHVSAEQRKAHGRSGHGSIKCDFVDPQTGERCDVVFRRPYDLARHKETIHEAKGKKKQQWVCGQCKGSFSRKDALMRCVSLLLRPLLC